MCERLDDARDVQEKRPHDLVTDADRASEALILSRIREAFPRAAILGEESGAHAGSGEERFIVDPLDGTTNYAHRYPLFCVSIAYERGGRVEAGAIFAPVLGELFAARRGGGATRNGAPMRVSRAATRRRRVRLHRLQPRALRAQRPVLRARVGPRAGGPPRRQRGARSRVRRGRRLRRILGVGPRRVGRRGGRADDRRGRRAARARSRAGRSTSRRARSSRRTARSTPSWTRCSRGRRLTAQRAIASIASRNRATSSSVV